MSNIFEIEQRYFRLLNEIEISEGEITEEVAEELKITEEDAKAKLNGYQRYILSLEGECETLSHEMERIANKIKSKTNLIERLKGVMKDALLLFGDEGKTGNRSLKTDLFNFYTVNRDSVDVDPVLCTLDNKDALGFLKVKLPLVLTPVQYLELKSIVANYETQNKQEVTVQHELYETIDNCVITVVPKKKELTSFLKDQSELEEKIKTKPELFDNDAKPIEIPGFKLITNTSIQVK